MQDLQRMLEYLCACAQAFDTMLLLKRGGEVIYNGPLGFQSRDMISYFESIPGEAGTVMPTSGADPPAWDSTLLE